jgi:HEPN domain-containing protein
MSGEAAREWLSVIEDDLKQVINNLDGPRPSPTGAAYHCQQAAEKLVKAILVSHDVDFPRTHDIAALIGLIPSQHPLKSDLMRFRQLTPYAIAYRYPVEDEWEMPSVEELRAWLNAIEQSLAELRSLLS